MVKKVQIYFHQNIRTGYTIYTKFEVHVTNLPTNRTVPRSRSPDVILFSCTIQK
jgi:hypothetical protein